MEGSFDLTNLRKANVVSLKIHPIVLRHLKRLYRILLRLELGKPFLLAEKPGEGVVEILVRALERLGVHFREPRIFFFEGGKTAVQVKAGEFSTCLLICTDLLFQ
ncbi:hypothetical protein DSECCO2_502220 [anaerobic digester metagenome]